MITVSMAYWRCARYVEKAVDSILSQTYRDIRLVLVNDGDDPPPLPKRLARDSRLIVLNLDENRGPYYCDAVVLSACDTPWFSIHASDDWSTRQRFADLMAASDGYDVVWGGSIQRRGNRMVKRATNFKMAATEDVLRHRGSIATGVFRTEAIRKAGAPHPEFRVAYDTMMVHLLCRAHRWRHLPGEAGYQRVVRPESLTMAPATGLGSAFRRETVARRDALWQRVIAAPMEDWPVILSPSLPVAFQVERDADRLRALL